MKGFEDGRTRDPYRALYEDEEDEEEDEEDDDVDSADEDGLYYDERDDREGGEPRVRSKKSTKNKAKLAGMHPLANQLNYNDLPEPAQFALKHIAHQVCVMSFCCLLQSILIPLSIIEETSYLL